jgi:UDP-N-acetylmuramoyl-tripeptide--D-alanyl-D-alanine ligase
VLELRQAFGYLSGGRLVAADPGEPPLVLTGVSTDTRAVRPGELFVALRGERFDAHDFVGQATAAGAERAVPRTVAVSPARLTEAFETPGSLPSARSTRATQDAQVMPSTGSVSEAAEAGDSAASIQTASDLP